MAITGYRGAHYTVTLMLRLTEPNPMASPVLASVDASLSEGLKGIKS